MSAIPDTEVKVIVGSGADATELTTWQRYDLEADLLQPSDAFSLTAPNNDGELAGVVSKGDLVKVLVDGVEQMVGYVDDVVYTSDDQGSRVEITGRDLFLFLVDCSAQPQSLQNKTQLQLADLLASDWVEEWSSNSTVASTTQIPRVKIEPGESILDVLLREAQKDNCIIWADAQGAGHIGRPDYLQEPLYNLYHYARGNLLRAYNNVITASVRESWRDQYSSITVHGTTGNTRANSGDSSRAKAVAVDTDIEPDRPLIISDGDVRTLKQAQNRADLERDRRAFDATVLEYTVKGHYGSKPDGRGGVVSTLWAIDTLVDVVDELAAKQGEYYITKRRFRGDDSGRFTDLTLHPKGVWLA